jgi:manganese transport protein
MSVNLSLTSTEDAVLALEDGKSPSTFKDPDPDMDVDCGVHDDKMINDKPLSSADEPPKTCLQSLNEFCKFLGPAFLISVAYMDPGNWATNISGGALHGTALLWVIVLASIFAMGIQSLAAKLGIATGKDLAQLCAQEFSKPVVYFLWLAAELAMIATDMAEMIGTAIGFQLVCNFPLWAGAILAAASSFALIGIRTMFTRGYRYIEFTIMSLVGIIALAFVIELFITQPTASDIFSGLKPTIPNTEALFIATGILGATVMPHSIYLHPYLVQVHRARLIEEIGDNIKTHRWHLRNEIIDTLIALTGAMFVNASMLIVAADALGGTGIESVEEAFTTLQNLFGEFSGILFGIALIASGLSSSLVALMSGQVVMDGFLNWKVNVWIRRSVTLVPSLIVVMIGLEPSKVLVASQVALSFELPFALIPLAYFCSNRRLMDVLVNHKATTIVLSCIIGMIVLLNAWLIISLTINAVK